MRYLFFIFLSLVGISLSATPLLELYPNFHTIGVNVHLNDLNDPENDAEITLKYAPSSAALKAGMPLSRVEAKKFSGAIVLVNPGQSFEVEVQIHDASTPNLDGIILNGNVSTRPTSEVAYHTPTHSYYVSPNGSGTFFTQSNPGNLSDALTLVQAGEEVVLLGGTYFTGYLNILSDGENGSPITIRGENGQNAVLDGTENLVKTWLPVSGYPDMWHTQSTIKNPNLVLADGERLYPHVKLADLANMELSCQLATPIPFPHNAFFRDPRNASSIPWNPNLNPNLLYVKFTDGSDPNQKTMQIAEKALCFDLLNKNYIHFRNLTIQHYGMNPHRTALKFSNCDNLVLSNCYLNMNDWGIIFSGNSDRNTVENCYFRDSIYQWNTFGYKATYEVTTPYLCDPTVPNLFPFNDRMLETGGIFYDWGFSGRGNIVRSCTFQGYANGFIGTPPSVSDSLSQEFDIYGNTFIRCDDGVEIDGISGNIRLWDNEFIQYGAAISLAVAEKGPVYIFRNRFHDGESHQFTLSGQSTLQTGYSLPFKFNYGSTSTLAGEVFFYHNTIHTAGDYMGRTADIFSPTDFQKFVSRNNLYIGGSNGMRIQTTSPIDLDYDGFYQTSYYPIVQNGIPYNTLADFQAASGQELHGIFSYPQFVDSTNRDYHLLAGSSAIDAGTFIPGINDDFYGSAPDMGSFEYATVKGDIMPKPSLSIYPNPSDGEINIQRQPETAGEYIRVFDLQGSLIKEIPWEKGKNVIHILLDQVPTGVYVIESEGQRWKWIKN